MGWGSLLVSGPRLMWIVSSVQTYMPTLMRKYTAYLSEGDVVADREFKFYSANFLAFWFLYASILPYPSQFSLTPFTYLASVIAFFCILLFNITSGFVTYSTLVIHAQKLPAPHEQT
ncbi:unnamed protein product [Protopolystoma xenopodis]|uniref:Uncharacterized protein n=1 Tax=Protopolystoma xenopodis TaxID=117903 RepID=A0A448WN39_9PLAT|nr:unnamed protein product [Protopolystoma xenopodis]